ncbi:MAG: 1-(5-phosphoribosyl) carboxylase [Candidatus Magnetoglobus multicellularis str. Araruama]|uniref:1-(5-phosphoribosyl) carboxylase n=1 Tax=Candidatus Magnetoglobus multicellularis str. Araruama TaxID=890399 RepID=A0A1V1PEE4_9BACT|nr:MAG: 1-(5-phosphoribosyl) carboxylase [Candidatus Magnetoglobus multicellularis str. Araruama]
MDEKRLKELLTSVANGQASVESALSQLKHIPYEDLLYAHVDHHRTLRKGFPEVIYGEGKRTQQIIGIMQAMHKQNSPIIVTRLSSDKAAKILLAFPAAQYYEDARFLICYSEPIPELGRGKILVISAGTSDIPVAREAYLTAKYMGNKIDSIYDVGVAGIHRLLGYREQIESASVLIVVAGMEGALPSVVAGLVDRPVIAVPTSVGYGLSLNGLSALLGMLNSCASNVAVVNIDNGFGAGYVASTINR